jgi:hypothetical protein
MSVQDEDYQPGPIPDQPEALPQFLNDDLHRLAGTLETYRERIEDGWADITSEVKARGVGATDPGWAQISATSFYAYSFALNDQVWMNFHIPHDYVLGTDIYLHAHWIPDGTNTNSVKWQFIYAYAHGHNQAAYNLAGTTITAEQTVGGTQYQHYVTETAAITITDMEPDGIIMVNITRITNGATDNTDGIFLLTGDIHYQSTGHGTPKRAPDFYERP